LSSIDLEAAQVRAALTENGVPNLWIPKILRRVDAIPVLASGKLDLARCKELATQGPAEPGSNS
jgi:acyl-[acyl-carrier-protein]-phospholipid O-acyltransferase/long-chain-fatty-acid--[acyl-carrier-protein] ligase